MTSTTCRRLLLLLSLSAFLGAAPLSAQRLQLQLSVGTNFSEAFLHDDALPRKETSVFYDSIGNAQFGLGLHARVYRGLHLRAELNYKNFRTFYDFTPTGGSAQATVLGNLYKENWTVSVLPEFRVNLLKPGDFSLPVYAFVGPVFSFEQAKNFSQSTIIDGGAVDVLDETDPDMAPGWSVGAGLNPKWRRLGVLAELRYTRTAAVSEGGPLPTLSFEHFAVLAGLTFDLVK